jgi:hypothetical protein
MRNRTLLGLLAVSTIGGALALSAVPAAARSCKELQSLCWTMRDDKSDCTKPYQRCLVTGTFVTPLGRVFKATK